MALWQSEWHVLVQAVLRLFGLDQQDPENLKASENPSIQYNVAPLLKSQ